MNRLPLLLAVAAILLLISGFVFSAPAQWGIAISDDGNACAGYWAGDEYSAYYLPEGWVPHYPNESDRGITVNGKSCDFGFRGDEEACCGQLGIPYVAKNIGEPQALSGYFGIIQMLVFWAIIFLVAILVVAVAVAYLVFIRKKPAQEREAGPALVPEAKAPLRKKKKR